MEKYNNWKLKFYTIWAGQAVSLITSAILQMAIIFYLTEKTGSAMVLSMASLVGFLPYAVFGPAIGVLVDRHDRKKIMIGYNKNIDRICFIIGNHHTPSKIDGLDFQIQWEADLLENLTVMDKEKEQEKIKKCIGENFKTNTGKRIAYNRFILD